MAVGTSSNSHINRLCDCVAVELRVAVANRKARHPEVECRAWYAIELISDFFGIEAYRSMQALPEPNSMVPVLVINQWQKSLTRCGIALLHFIQCFGYVSHATRLTNFACRQRNGARLGSSLRGRSAQKLCREVNVVSENQSAQALSLIHI